MSELRKAAYWALDALKDRTPGISAAGAIEALEAALEQPEPEPVTWRYDYTRLPQRKPLTDEEINVLMPEADGTAEANKVWNKNGDFPYLEYDEVDAWSKPLVILIVRFVERIHGIGGQP